MASLPATNQQQTLLDSSTTQMLVDDNNTIIGNSDDTFTGNNTGKEKVKKWDIFTGKELGTADHRLSLGGSELKRCCLFCL